MPQEDLCSSSSESINTQKTFSVFKDLLLNGHENRRKLLFREKFMKKTNLAAVPVDTAAKYYISDFFFNSANARFFKRLTEDALHLSSFAASFWL